jgi:hypothetical protein
MDINEKIYLLADHCEKARLNKTKLKTKQQAKKLILFTVLSIITTSIFIIKLN